jgi:hypothetical protein
MQYITLLAISLIIIFAIACTDKIEGDIHPDIPLFEDWKSNSFEVTDLRHLKGISYKEDGTIHAFGKMKDKKGVYFFQYDNNFDLQKTVCVLEKNQFGWFIDDASNLYLPMKQGTFKYHYPSYDKPTLIPLHPIHPIANEILAQQLQASKRGYNSKRYHELKKAGKEKEIKVQNDKVADDLWTAYQQNINKDNIKSLWKFQKGQILTTKDGQEYTLYFMQTAYGKSSLSKYLKGLNNITVETNALISLPPIVNCVEKTGFSVTESKTTLQNWPNQGYTKGLYYYEITLEGNKETFKVEHRKGRTPVSERSRKGDDFMFLNYNGWHLIRLKK